ncbi:hypothetical protein ACIA5H_31710 [Nocardia sp. NPDC051900]|uniref:hypothetical protein n=1 Tax=Nocardia sp. NPDC051900 TaxID=3364326 RepID=UPI0037889243
MERRLRHLPSPALTTAPARRTDRPPLAVAAAIVLLYAQSVSRIIRLTIDDVLDADGHVLPNLGEPPSPVPRPVAELLLSWIDQRANMNTATNRDSR